jgi:hypothetical protein
MLVLQSNRRGTIPIKAKISTFPDFIIEGLLASTINNVNSSSGKLLLNASNKGEINKTHVYWFNDRTFIISAGISNEKFV